MSFQGNLGVYYFMTTAFKILSAVAATGLIGGTVIDTQNIDSHPGLAAVLPLGAIAFGVSLVMYMLEKEMAQYDAEQAAKSKRIHATVIPFPAEKQSSEHTELTDKAA